LHGNRARGLALDALTGHVAERLEAAGVRVLPLKGPALARRLHGDAGLRATNDVDLLVAREQLGAAAEVLAGVGYRVERDADARQDELHLTLRDPAERLTRIDLHWRIHWYEDDFSRALLDRSGAPRERPREPAPADDLAALLLFYARDGFFGLRHSADVAAWWDRHGHGHDHGAPVLAEHWERHSALRRPLLAAAAAAERIVGVPAAGVLPAQARPEPRTRLAVRLAPWTGAGEPDQLAANLTLVDLLLSPPGGLRPTLRRHVLLPARRLESTYRLPPGPSLRRAVWRVLHPPKMAVRYLLGVGGAFTRRPQRVPCAAP
jgi:hypothetical protein